MQRRNVLKQLGAIMVASIGYSSINESMANEQTSNKKRIAVIGAGLSGLAAATALQKQGHDVFVIEGRERIGGRIWTSTKWQDMPLDFGATWIHGVKGNPITDLADSIQAPRIATSYDSAITYNTSGKPLSGDEESRLEQLREEISSALEKAQDIDPDVSIRQALESMISQFPASSETHKFINFILNSEIEQEYGGSVSQVSTHWYDDGKEFEGGDVLFAQGYRVITEYLARGLKIELGQTVKEIQWYDDAPVRITTQASQFVADSVVVTLPLGVLQSNQVRFSPELPASKQSAIAHLKMGVLNKCYLRFPDSFWPDDVDWLEYIPEKHGEWAEWVSFKQAAKLPILLGFNAADRGREIEKWSDQQIIDSAMQTLRTLYGKDIPEPIDHQITRWASDPFALGSYSYNPVGASPETRQELAKSLNNKVFFAGEATNKDYFGTAHGAYLSGLQAAKQIGVQG